MSLVLDSSVAIAWCIKGEQTPELLQLLRDVQAQELYVPAIWPVEVANILTNARNKNRLDSAEFDDAVLVLQSLEIKVSPSRAVADLPMMASMMNTHGLTAYNAEYLALALQLGEEIATLDKQLRVAATAEGIKVFP